MLNPEFWLDEDVAKLSAFSRLLYMGLWGICDDNYATLPDRPEWIKAQVFPYEEINIEQMLKELALSGKIIKFEVDNKNYWYIKNFFKHQRVDRPSSPKYPKYPLSLADDSTSTRSEDKLSKDKLSKDNESSPSFEGVRDLVNYFFELKGWANKEKSFYKEKDIRYAHHAKRAKELLDLCEGDVLEAKECMRKMSEWATSRELTWTVETIFKHWYDIDLLKPKEKKPYWDNCRIFQKSAGGRWWIIRNGEIKELGRELKQEEISWK